MILLDLEDNGGGGAKLPVLPQVMRVDMAKEPPKEVLEQTFSSDPKLINSDARPAITGDTTPVKVEPAKEAVVAEEKLPFVKPEEIKGEEKKESKQDDSPAKFEEKKEDKVSDITKILRPPKGKEGEKEQKVTPEEAKVEGGKVKQITPVKDPETSHFDYAGFSNDEVLYLKNMSRQSREYAAKLIKDNKELAKLKDSTWLQHPQAHTLSPEYQQTQFLIGKASREAEYWKQQLVLARTGKDVTELAGWNDDGSPKLGNSMKPTEEIEIEIQRCMQNCYSIRDNAQADLKKIPEKFKSTSDNDLRLIQQERKARFAWAEKPELLDYSVTTDTGEEKTIKNIREDMASLWPPYLRSHPAVEVCGDLMASLVIQSALLREAQQTTQVAETKVQEVKRGEPGSVIKPAKVDEAVANGVPKVFSLEGMPR